MRPASAALAALAAAALTAATGVGQTFVSLASQQTPFRDQGSRRTCICFAGIAALEARYRRLGYGELDLSEEFCSNVLNKTFWLHPNWNDPKGPPPVLGTAGADRSENQLATTGGGNGAVVLKALASGGAVPQENYLPYVDTPTVLQPYPDYKHPYWESQRNSSTWNLDRVRLPRKALTAPRYYSATGVTYVSNPQDPAQIEAVVKYGIEVVIDFYTGGYMRTNGLWTTKNEPLTGLDTHAMLVVGFDKRSSNPNDWYFLCKNSWGPNGAMPSGFTHISYGYLQKYVYGGSYLLGVNPPKPWPELAAVGRWNLCFDGHRGTLDIYHIPGTAQQAMGHLGIVDRRLGTFHDSNGVAHRVNGIVSGNRVEFWFKSSNPNMRWDELRETPTLGRRFVYYLVDPVKGEMAGWHQDNAGLLPNPAWGGYARVPSTILGNQGYLQPNFNNSLPMQPEMYLGLWSVKFDRTSMQINIVRRNDQPLTPTQRQSYVGFDAIAIESGRRTEFSALVSRSRAADITLQFPHSTRGPVKLRGYMLSHQRGVTAGNGYYGQPTTDTGFYMYRTGDSTHPSVKSYYGTACTGTNGTPIHRINGIAQLGNQISFDLTGGARSAQAILSMGSTTASLDLTAIGAPGCSLLTDHLFSQGVVTQASGTAAFPIKIPNRRSLLGYFMTSQYVVLDSGANRAGLTTSNGATLKVGGIR